MDPEDIRCAARRRETSLNVEVVGEAPEWEAVEGLEAAIVEAARSALRAIDTARADVGIVVALLSDEAMRELNRRFRGQDKPTNVLSFQAAADGNEAELVASLGDIALAYGTVAREAKQRGVELIDHVRHLTVHGTLHLLGCDHQTDAEADAMEALETRILAQLGVADPYDWIDPDAQH
jgi:probable rRNA maturation factor